GAVARACGKRGLRAASASSAGVSPRPTRSARSVSIVMRRTLGFCAGGGGAPAHAAHSRHNSGTADRVTLLRLSAIGYRLSAVGSQLSALRYRLVAFRFRLGASRPLAGGRADRGLPLP